jgi:nondiscriminating glutamyl-tRNA synthetase
VPGVSARGALRRLVPAGPTRGGCAILEETPAASDGTVRVRFAPSPTGSLHIGGARTALFNWLLARKRRGRFILRFEDTDRSRSTEEAARSLAETLRWLGLDWDEGPGVGGAYGPYRQTERAPLYRAAADRLLAEGKAYPCYCTPDELAARREAARREGRAPRYDGRCRHLTAAERAALEARGRVAAVRLRVPEQGRTVFRDLIYGELSFDNAELDDFVIMKSDGLPTYNFAVVVDDAHMRVTHVIRGEEHLSNTPKQLHVYAALGETPPAFAHVPMILAPDRSKLSKRHGAVAVEEFRAAGFLPEAVLNYCALLGWSPGEDREILSRDELVERFDLSRVSRSAAIYDVRKMRWVNGEHLRRASPETLVEWCLPWLDGAGLPAREADRSWLARVLAAVQERVETLGEVPAAVEYFFRPPAGYDEAGVRKHFGPGTADRLRLCAARLAALEDWSAGSAEAAYRALADEMGVKAAALIHPTRLALTGRTVGPSLFLIVELLGREETCRRLRQAADLLAA